MEHLTSNPTYESAQEAKDVATTLEDRLRYETITPDNFHSMHHSITSSVSIGRGRWGEIYRAKRILTGEEVVVKLPIIDERNKQKLKDRNHTPFDVARKEGKVIPGAANVVQETPYVTNDGKLYFDMPKLDWDVEGLLSHSDKNGPLTTDQQYKLVRDVAIGIRSLHEHGIIHRDITAKNVLIKDNTSSKEKGKSRYTAMVADRGAATLDSEGNNSHDLRGAIQAGPREGYLPNSTVSFPADSYGAGQVIFKLLTKKGMYDDDLKLAEECGINPREWMNKYMTSHDELWIRNDVAKRIKNAKIPSHFQDLLEKCLDPDPSQRPQNGEELVHLVESAEKSRPLNRLKRWRMGLLGAALVGGAAFYGIHSDAQRLNLVDQLKDKQNELSIESKLGHIRLHASGSSGFDSWSALAHKELTAWEEKFQDKQTAYAAYLNPQVVFDAIHDLNIPTNKPIKYDSIQKYVEKHDQKMSGSMIETLGIIDGFVRSDFTYGDNRVKQQWAEASTNYANRKSLEFQEDNNRKNKSRDIYGGGILGSSSLDDFQKR